MIAMIADISSGNTGFADIMFLVALILFLIAGFVAFQVQTFYATVLALGLAAVSLGWLVL
jgi:uncharacterized membrane protein YtjA (UPF0391 family)